VIFQGDFQDESGRTAGIALIADRRGVDGVFAGNDMMAVGLLDALADAGVDVPGEMMVVGFDDVPIARYARPSLTTMRVAIADIGRRAFARLQASIALPGEPPAPTERVIPELIMRASTARAGSTDANIADRPGRTQGMTR
jgi:LacI family transcriptional regulator